MADCKKCLHTPVCEKLPKMPGATIAECAEFKDSTKLVERPKGRWDETDWVKYDGHGECIHYPKAGLRCSNCCNAFKKDLLWKRNFCPNCGADMRGESDGNL